MPEDSNLVENESMLFYLAPFQKEKSISKGGRDLLSHPPADRAKLQARYDRPFSCTFLSIRTQGDGPALSSGFHRDK